VFRPDFSFALWLRSGTLRKFWFGAATGKNVWRYTEEMAGEFGGVKFEAATSAEEAVSQADLVITATPSRQPIVRLSG